MNEATSLKRGDTVQLNIPAARPIRLLSGVLRCAKPLAEHRRLTIEDINATKGATYHAPGSGVF